VFYESSGRLRYARRGTPTDTTGAASADASFGLSAQPKPFSWLSLNPSLTSSWTDPDLGRGGPRGRGVRTDRLSASAALTQTYYGQFRPRLGPLTGLRHVVKPSLGVSYQAARADTGGALGFGGRTSRWRQSRQLDLRLDNTFWARLQRGEEESKVRLAQLNLATAYDLERDRRRLAPLTTSLAVTAGRRLDSRLSLRSGFYDPADRFQAWPRLEQLEVNTNLRLAGSGQAGSDSTARSQPRGRFDAGDEGGSFAATSRLSDYGYERGLQQDLAERPDRQSLQLSHYYARTRTGAGTSARSWLRAGTDLNWRRRWSLHYSVSYDLRSPGRPVLSPDRVTAELLSLQRSFHDWVAVFSLEPSRFHRDHAFYLKAQFKDIPQLKLERGDSRR
jgi:predicted DNA-binding ribbon-helix-helix protein